MAVKGSCHCRATQFEVSDAPQGVTRCTCSFCAKRGALWSYYTPEQFTLTTARDRVSSYQWRSHTVHHHHCAICGCGAYTESPECVEGKPHPTKRKIGVNARLFDEIDIEKLPVTVIDGKNLW